jgi:hypothetical protein
MAGHAKLSEKISLAKCKEFLNRNGRNYTDEQLLAIRDFLFEIAQIDYDVFIYNEQKEAAFKSENKCANQNDFKNAA